MSRRDDHRWTRFLASLGSFLLLVVAVVAWLAWIVNPFAAALLVLPVHLWIPILAPAVRVRRGLGVFLVLALALVQASVLNRIALPAGPAPISFGQNGASNAEVHNTGEVWATMLWECYVSLLRGAARGLKANIRASWSRTAAPSRCAFRKTPSRWRTMDRR